MSCPRCGSVKIHGTREVYCPEGVKAFQCDECYCTWYDKNWHFKDKVSIGAEVVIEGGNEDVSTI